MKQKKVIFGLLIVIYLHSTLLFSQTINIEEFIDRLKGTHPIFEKEKLTLEIEKEAKDSYLGNKDWNFISSLNMVHEEPAFAYSDPERTDALYMNTGFEKLFWETGGRISATISSGRADIYPNYGYPDPFYQNQINITYTHPLLKNRKAFLDKLQYELKQFDIDFSEMQSKENLENFILNSVGKFLDWVFLTEYKKIINERLKLSKEELARTQKKKSANLVDKADVIRAENAVRFWKQEFVSIQSQWNAKQAEIAVLLQNNEIYNLAPKMNIYKYKSLNSIEKLISNLKNKSRLLNTIKIRLDQLHFSLLGVEETSKPHLALILQGSLKNLDEDFSEAIILDEPSTSVGLEFSLPLGNHTSKHNSQKTKLQISQLKKQFDDLTLTLVSSLTTLYIQINELENILTLNQEQIEATKQRTKEELKLYNQGRGDLTFIIMSRDNEENAKLTYVLNSVKYHKLIFEFKELTDQLYK